MLIYARGSDINNSPSNITTQITSQDHTEIAADYGLTKFQFSIQESMKKLILIRDGKSTNVDYSTISIPTLLYNSFFEVIAFFLFLVLK